MNFIKPSIELVKESDSLRKIELCGRVCYKSEEKMTKDSAERFVSMIKKKGHTSVLEHVIVEVVANNGFTISERTKYINYNNEKSCYYGNVRAWLEVCQKTYDGSAKIFINKVKHSLYQWNPILFSELKVECKEVFPVQEYTDYSTLRFICDRGVSHNAVRHRILSFSQESTRYCDYGNNGFSFITDVPWEVSEEIRLEINDLLEHIVRVDEKMKLAGWTPEKRRMIYPNCLKTEIIVTGTNKQWEHFIQLRAEESAHPQIKELAIQIKELIICN